MRAGYGGRCCKALNDGLGEVLGVVAGQRALSVVIRSLAIGVDIVHIEELGGC